MSEKKMKGHVYDGIEELDNGMPAWMGYLFFGTILFGAIYFFFFFIYGGPTLVQEYQKQKEKVELAALGKGGDVKPPVEDELRGLLKQPARLKSGKDIFQVRCVSCHGAKGEGGIGPNLTDDYWIHGGKMVEIVNTITKGVAEKGMPPWGPILNRDEIHSLAAYIKSMRGTNPPNAKGPEGELVRE